MSSVAQEPLLATSVTHVAGPSRPTEFDPFFKSSSDGILKTYEFTYDALTSFKQELAFSFLVAEAFVPPVCPFIVCCGMPFFYLCQKQNIRDAAHAQHLAITHDGIKYVVDKHKSGCRFDCQDRGKVSKTVPYDKMTDCDIQEPAGSSGPCCWLVPNVLHTVHVDTASSGAVTEAGINHELTIQGLVDPEGFKRDVWAMKRGEPVDGVDGTVAPIAVSMIRDTTRPPMDKGHTNEPLLAEQNALLKEMLVALKARDEPASEQRNSSQELRQVAEALGETNTLLKKVADALAKRE